MKWISLTTAMLLLASTAHSQDSSDFLRTPEFTDLLKEANAPQSSNLTPGKVTLSAKERAELHRRPENAPLRLPSLDEFTGNKEDALDYRRIELFAPGATIRLISPSGITLIKPDRRVFYLATNETTGIGLAIDPDSGNITGFASKGGQKLEISGTDGMNLELLAVEPLPAGSDSCGTRIEDQQDFDLAKALGGTARSLSAVTAGGGITYQAEVAIDTDNEWMAGKDNNPTTAMNFITDIFLAMNVFYERDVETRLLVGDVTLRTANDPYTVTGRSAQLDEFAQYWRINQGSVERDFATLFSGRDINRYSFSGIAWLDQYCKKGSVWGSRT
ncbi:zinc-dependent metalloprotease family protein, partial [Pseudomonadota bacterium]